MNSGGFSVTGHNLLDLENGEVTPEEFEQMMNAHVDSLYERIYDLDESLCSIAGSLNCLLDRLKEANE